MATIAPLRSLIVSPAAKHTATVIFVHGLGDTGHGWEPVAKMLAPKLPHVKWVLPHAPTISITANMGMLMPGWFDIKSFDFKTAEDEAGMMKTVHSLNQLITAEVDGGIDASRIVLGGFSQGGAMTLLTGLTGERKLAGLVVLSGWLPLRNKVHTMFSDKAKEARIFWGHGEADPLVKYEYATASRDFLKNQLKMEVTSGPELKGLSFNTYPGLEHSTAPQELRDMVAWLEKALPPS
ncbi:Phospholipase/carboxylesterase [Punctularia strigosozonata HHB-11173 SS5]|uniref:Phospholipase/carboxylesterase n=1 Tax=Punctularia strigosozonata (strain HHB-11173) TaxID=741275 RepID=UPI0004417D2D|nr:Phospholipase/carboxylesterase [Punctularia strigosozonata HHB-11173 SS5]EIN11066.1 Phospholipase/carboxylesterase [Punctularia strigosozonata HHB-11173 SS5]